jgi:Tfp pilus assembly protein FimT
MKRNVRTRAFGARDGTIGRLQLRAGFTLWEISLVFAVLVITLVLAAPALVDFGTQKQQTDADALLGLLRDSRRQAVQHSALVAVRLDPTSGKYRVDTTGVHGMGTLREGELELSGATVLVTDLARLQFLFQPTGASFSDSVGVRGPNGTVMVMVDPWSGVARAETR